MISDDSEEICDSFNLSSEEHSLPNEERCEDMSTIQNNIEHNEKMLAKILDLNCLEMDHEDVPVASFPHTYSPLTENTMDNISCKPLSYGPPSSGNSSVPTFPSIESTNSVSSTPIKERPLPLINLWEEPLPEKLLGNWTKHILPSQSTSLVGLYDERFCFSFGKRLFISSKISTNCTDSLSPLIWTEKLLPFDILRMSSNEKFIVFLAKNESLFVLPIHELERSYCEPKFLAMHVKSASIACDIIWTLNSDSSVRVEYIIGLLFFQFIF